MPRARASRTSRKNPNPRPKDPAPAAHVAQSTRRQFLSRTAASLAAARLLARSKAVAQTPPQKIRVGFVGTGIRFHTALGKGFTKFGPCLAICDVDARQRERAAEVIQLQHEQLNYGARPELCEDYRRILDDPDIDVVVIATPDHWANPSKSWPIVRYPKTGST